MDVPYTLSESWSNLMLSQCRSAPCPVLLAATAGLAVAGVLALTACQAGGSQTPPSPQPGREAPAPPATARPSQSVGTLVARAQLAGQPGAPPAPGQGAPAIRVFGPVADAVVQVVSPAAPQVVVAERVADASGEVRLDLPPGRYWVFVPWRDQVPGRPGATPVGAHLPDGRAVLAWAEVEVPSGGTIEVPLTIFVALA